MKVRELLPELATRAPDCADLDIDLGDDESLGLVLDRIDDLYESACLDGWEGVEAVARALLADAALDARYESPVVGLLRLHIAVAPLEFSAGHLRFDRAWHWAVAPCVDGMPGGLEAVADWERPWRATRRYPLSGLSNLVRWAGQVCYLAWAAGYLHAEASIVAITLAPVLEHMGLEHPRLLVPMAHVATHLHSIGDHSAVGLVRRLDELSAEPALDNEPDVKAFLEALLSGTFARHTGVPGRERAARALVELDAHLAPLVRLQLLVAACAEDAAATRARLHEIEGAVDSFWNEVNDAGSKPLGLLYMRGRMFNIIGPAVLALAKEGDAANSHRLIARWHGHHDPGQPPPLMCIRRHDRYLWVADGRRAETELREVPMTALVNEALGLTLVDTVVPIDPRVPIRIGVPEPEAATVLRDAAMDSLQPATAVELLTQCERPPTGLVNLAFERLPVPHFVQEAGGPLLPLVVSFQTADVDRDLKVAEVWTGSPLLADLEGDTVAKILRQSGMRVRVVRAADEGAEAFLASYEDPSLDLLWVSSHAEFGHWQPDETALVLSDDVAVSLADFAVRTVAGPGRRLLVLNTCDSASAAGLGGPSQVGLAGVTAGSFQAVISHLWPIHFRAGARFGALLAIGLAKFPDFLEAFRFACASRSHGQTTELLYAVGADELADATSAGDGDATFLDLASPAFVI